MESKKFYRSDWRGASTDEVVAGLRQACGRIENRYPEQANLTIRCSYLLREQESEIARLREVLKFAGAKFENYFEEYGAEHSEDECPEDDTCECPLVLDMNEAFRRINAALSPQEPK